MNKPLIWIVKCKNCKYEETFNNLGGAEEDRQEHEVENNHNADIEEKEE